MSTKRTYKQNMEYLNQNRKVGEKIMMTLESKGISDPYKAGYMNPEKYAEIMANALDRMVAHSSRVTPESYEWICETYLVPMINSLL